MRTKFNYKILEKEKYTLHTIAHLTIFTQAFYHMRAQNFLKELVTVRLFCLLKDVLFIEVSQMWFVLSDKLFSALQNIGNYFTYQYGNLKKCLKVSYVDND